MVQKSGESQSNQKSGEVGVNNRYMIFRAIVDFVAYGLHIYVLQLELRQANAVMIRVRM